ncbi:MAG: RNA methyltransferase [Sphingobacteriales bacterium]|nr:MAG: RNA methyltransferase [Sphingobacteriales bacterium]
MLTKAQGKYIRSLSTPAGRKAAGAFVLEGPKLLLEWLRQAPETLSMIVVAESWAEPFPESIAPEKCFKIRDSEFESLSQFKSPPGVLAVAILPKSPAPVAGGWTLACETIQDPGNLGTILRIADWYGIDQVVCTPGSADFYNAKVIQSAMGAHLRVRMIESPLEPLLSGTSLPVYAAALSGTDLHQYAPVSEGILLIGNESKGLSQAVLDLATHQVTIPRRGGAESLNAAVAAGILCDRLRA